MLLLGGFQLSPVPQNNIEKATSQLKLYSSGLLNRGIPCRFLSHYIIHLPEDVEKCKCGIEAISAFPFESFMNIFRALTRSENLLAEQFRNKFIERSKYLLPTNSDGDIITEQELMDMTDDPAPRYKHAGVNRPKTLAFPNFKLSTRFQNNFCLLMDKSKKKSPQVFVLTDILKHVQGNCRYRLIGQKFIKLEDAFEEPFKSSEFQIYIASHISSTTFECDENMILSRIARTLRGYNYLGKKKYAVS